MVVVMSGVGGCEDDCLWRIVTSSGGCIIVFTKCLVALSHPFQAAQLRYCWLNDVRQRHMISMCRNQNLQIVLAPTLSPLVAAGFVMTKIHWYHQWRHVCECIQNDYNQAALIQNHDRLQMFYVILVTLTDHGRLSVCASPILTTMFANFIPFILELYPYDCSLHHDDVIKWKHFPRYWAFVRGIHRSTVNSLHKGQWRGALMFSLIYAWIKVE